MPNSTQFDDEKFQDALSELLLFNTPNPSIKFKTKKPKEIILKFEAKLKDEWMAGHDIEPDFQKMRAILRGERLLYMAYEAFLASKKMRKEVYKNNVGTDRENITHKITPAGPGDTKWFSLLLDLTKWLHSVNFANANDSATELTSYLDLVRQIEEYKEKLEKYEQSSPNISD